MQSSIKRIDEPAEEISSVFSLINCVSILATSDYFIYELQWSRKQKTYFMRRDMTFKTVMWP